MVSRASGAGLEVEQHDNLSRCLSAMRAQAHGLRALMQQASGRRSRLSVAAIALVEAVGHLQETLLAAHDAAYGAEQHPQVRTRYQG
jgi:hypothetical protein